MKCSVVVCCMILLHTTIYKPYREILRAGPGPARPRARRGRNLALCGPWQRFPGSAAPIPYPRPVSGFLGAPARPGCGFGPSSSGMAMLASSVAWLSAFPLAFNLRPSSSRRRLRLARPRQPLFLLNLLFLGCRAAAVLDECAGCGAATGAACRALGKPVLADRPGTIAGGGAGEAGGTPEGCPAEGAGRRLRRRGGGPKARRVGAPVGRCGGSVCAVG